VTHSGPEVLFQDLRHDEIRDDDDDDDDDGNNNMSVGIIMKQLQQW